MLEEDKGVGLEDSQREALGSVVDVLERFRGSCAFAALVPNAGRVICSRINKGGYQLKALGQRCSPACPCQSG